MTQPNRKQRSSYALTHSEWTDFGGWVRSEGCRRLRKTWYRSAGSLVLGVICSWAIPLPLHEVATSIASSYGSVLVGITFAWSVTIASLLQTDDARELGEGKGGHVYRNWVMNYQFSLVTIFTVVLMWALIGARIASWPAAHTPKAIHFIARSLALSATAFMLTEMYDAIARVQKLLLTVEFMRRGRLIRQNPEHFSEYVDDAPMSVGARVVGEAEPEDAAEKHEEIEADGGETPPARARRG